MAKYYRGKGKKRAGRSRRRTTNRSVFRPQRGLSTAFPKTNMIKLKYVETISLDPGLGISASHFFRANSIFDPNETGVGHQPLGFDQWTQFYNHYVVVGSLCKATYAKTDATATGGIDICGIQLTDDTTTSSNMSTILEQSLTNKSYSYRSVHTSRPIACRKGFSAKKFFNVTNVSDNFDRLGALVSANPSEQAYFEVFTVPASSTVDPTGLTVIVEIIYTVMFSEPKELAQS